jgi:putative endopeptidase
MEKTEKQAPAIDVTNMDTTVSPGENFYLYANGGWMKNNPIPEEYGRFGTFDQLGEHNNELVRDLIIKTAEETHEDGSIAQKIGDFYNMGMDSATIEQQGLDPLKDEFAKIDAIQNKKQLQEQIAYMHTIGIYPLFYMYGSSDSKNSEMVVTHLSQGGLGLTDRDYYVSDDARSQEIRNNYLTHVTKMFELLGNDSVTARQTADMIMDFETKLAKASMTRLERRDPYKTYNKMDLSKLTEESPNYNWTGYFTEVGLGDPGDIIVGQPAFFSEVSDAMNNESLDNWKTYLKWNLVNRLAPYLSSAFVNQNFEFYGKQLSGSEVIRPRWKRVLSATNGAMGEALGQLYVKAYFPPEAKQRVLDLVENLRIALGQRIDNLAWMSDTTKERAHEKLAAINVKMGYPDKWRDYSGLNINKDAWVLNVLRSNKFDFEYELSKINKPVDHSEWHMTPQTVNAYYSPNMNEICFPAGILQPPFFYMHGDDAVNYGAIGVVIGHEMSHGFDDQGRQYDKEGNLTDWWTPEDAKQFKEHTQVLVDEFNKFVVLDSIHADGELTLGENIADLGGLNISFTAYQNAIKGKPAPEPIDGFTDTQRFFLAYAHVWAQNTRDKEILRRTKEDVHSLGEFRVLGPLPNLAEFYKAFNITPEDAMYIPEDQRAVIW